MTIIGNAAAGAEGPFEPVLKANQGTADNKLTRAARMATKVLAVVMPIRATSSAQGDDNMTMALCTSGVKMNHMRARE